MPLTVGIDYVSKLDVEGVRRVQPVFVSLMEEDVDAPYPTVIKAQETSFFAEHGEGNRCATVDGSSLYTGHDGVGDTLFC